MTGEQPRVLIRQHPSRPLEFRHPELNAMPPTDRNESVDGPEGGEAGDSAGDANVAVEG